MAEITLTAEQVRVVATAAEQVAVRDTEGNVLGVLTVLPSWSEEELREIDRKWQEAKFDDCITTTQLLERLHALGEP
jgi:hypothetical protein